LTLDFQTKERPVVDYLLKEIAFSTCDNKFFGELEKEMLIPNNLNIFGRITGADNLRDHTLRVEFPRDTTIAFLKRPSSNIIENGKRVLTYPIEDLINYDDYWWLPLHGETEFVLQLNLLPPFPQLNPIDLAITCRPDIAVGVEAYVTTTISLKAEEHIDNIFLTMSTPPFAAPGVSMAITEYSGDDIAGPRQSVTAPAKKFPFPRLSLKPGEAREYKVTTKITADVGGMTSLKCQHDLLKTRLVLLSESSPPELPCAVSILDEDGNTIPVRRTARSTILQTQAQIMYSPFSIRREDTAQPEKRLVAAQAAQ
jgi:hypothetical protein